MVLTAVLILIFTAALGVYMIKNFLETQRHATAVDAAEKIYNAADLLAAGAGGSTRTIWVKVPNGYSITLNGGVTLKEGDRVVGKSMNITGVNIMGNGLPGGDSLPGRDDKYRLRLNNSGTGIIVSEIKE